MVIPEANNLDDSGAQSCRVILLLDVVSKLDEGAAAHLIADYLERKRKLRDGVAGHSQAVVLPSGNGRETGAVALALVSVLHLPSPFSVVLVPLLSLLCGR